MDEKILYGAVLVAAGALLSLAFLSFLAPPAAAQNQGAGQPGPAIALGSPPPECGDINDPSNLQHLSHHPDRFQECYKYVNPVKFKQAVGQDLSNFQR
ncbi:MAG: hypothetical protein AB1529_01035 [Candidatus Micrarchaeota archaeon]